MEKFKRTIALLGCLILTISGGIGYKLINNTSESKISKQEKKETLAMYIQDIEGNYQTSNAKEFPKEGYVLNLEKSTCKNGGVLYQDSITKKIKVSLNHNDQCSLYFDKEVPKIEIGDTTLKGKGGTPNFANPATTDETADGLYAMKDDYGTSYYFRGAVENNYVKFGTNANGEEMWWRIIRFNGDGSIRMQYDGAGTTGENTYTRGFALTKSQRWNINYEDAKYVGWMFGGAQSEESTSKAQAQTNETDSEIKIAVDNWYKSNIVDTGYNNFVADTIFCNDRSTPGKSATGWTSDTGLGYARNFTAYGAFERFLTGNNSISVSTNENPKPQFTCPQDNDKFTLEESSGGNGALTYPVGLITADEIVAAGSGKFETINNSYYLKKGKYYWSFSPINCTGAASVLTEDNGTLSYRFAYDTIRIAPVINIKSEYLSQFKGTGLITDPFHLEVE